MNVNVYFKIKVKEIWNINATIIARIFDSSLRTWTDLNWRSDMKECLKFGSEILMQLNLVFRDNVIRGEYLRA